MPRPFRGTTRPCSDTEEDTQTGRALGHVPGVERRLSLCSPIGADALELMSAWQPAAIPYSKNIRFHSTLRHRVWAIRMDKRDWPSCLPYDIIEHMF